MKVRLSLGLLCFAIPVSWTFAEVGIIISVSSSPSLIVVQGTPGDPDVHPKRLDSDREPLDSGTSGVQRAPGSTAGTLRVWSSVIHLDAEFVLNPGGDLNGDGEPSLGFGETMGAVPPTLAWARRVGPGNHDPVYAQFVDGSWTPPILIASNPGDDLDPRWWQDAEGTIHASWWRAGAGGAGGEVLYAERVQGSGAFSSEERVSSAGAAARGATMAVLPEGTVLVGYETDPVGGMRNVVVASRPGPMEAFQNTTLAATPFARTTRPELSNKGEYVWLTWIDTESRVGFREWSGGAWSAPAYESYSGDGDIGRARMRIQTHLLSQRPTFSFRRPLTKDGSLGREVHVENAR